jgi:hypothetical protein
MYIISGILYCFCAPCCAGRLHGRSGEHFCTCLVPGATQALRAKVRMGYGIRVSFYLFFRIDHHFHHCIGHTSRRLFGILLKSLLFIADKERTRSTSCTRSLFQIDILLDFTLRFYNRTQYIITLE